MADLQSTVCFCAALELAVPRPNAFYRLPLPLEYITPLLARHQNGLPAKYEQGLRPSMHYCKREPIIHFPTLWVRQIITAEMIDDNVNIKDTTISFLYLHYISVLTTN